MVFVFFSFTEHGVFISFMRFCIKPKDMLMKMHAHTFKSHATLIHFVTVFICVSMQVKNNVSD